HYNLGFLLGKAGKPAEAEAACRKAIAFQPDNPQVHCILGEVLRQQGRFAESLAALKRGHQLSLKKANWPYPSSQGVRQAQKLADLDARLPKFLSGEAQPAGATEGIALAEMCQLYKKQYAAAARFFAGAFASQPKLAADLGGGHRYNAACAAALAGCG